MILGGRRPWWLLSLALGALLTAGSAGAIERPEQVAQIGVDEHLGEVVPRSLVFVDEHGRSVTLGTFFDGRRPVVLVPVYYGCPRLCTFVLNGVLEGLQPLTRLRLGRDFTVVAFSFDPDETPELAAKKAGNYRQALAGTGHDPSAWSFLTGSPKAITALTRAIGYRYLRDADGEFAHPSAIVVLTPEGRIARYLYGVRYTAQDLQLALLEAADGQIGGTRIVNQVLLYCFKYDPVGRKYVLYARNVMKLGGLVSLTLVAGLLVVLWRRERRGQGTTLDDKQKKG